MKQEPSRATVGIPFLQEGEDVKLAETIRTEIMEYVAPMFEQIMVRMDTLATKEDVAKCATKEELAEVRLELAKCATKDDLDSVRQDVAVLAEDMVGVKRHIGAMAYDVGKLKENYGTMDGKLDRIILFLGMPQS